MHRILIVDDDPDIASVVKLILDMNGFESEFIINYKELENKLITYSPQLLILDISLGGADGRDLCLQMKSQKMNDDMPIVLFSANRDASADYKTYKADAFISKPFDSKKLLETVNHFFTKAA